MSQDTNLTSLIINKMTKAQYDALENKNANELYFITDNSGIVAGTGLALNGYTINHSNSVAAATAGTSSATSGSTLAVPYLIYDGQGHITGSGVHTHTITGFTTVSDVNGLISTAIGGISSFNAEVVASLPTTDIDEHTIYFVPNSGTGTDVYDEYMYINNSWEKIGNTQVDLSGYVPTSRTINGKALSSNISLTATDVGALSDSTTIPTATSDLTNDSGYLTLSTLPVYDGTVVINGTTTNYATLEDVEEATTLAYSTTLSSAGWSGNTAPYTYQYTNSSLMCGKNGDVPPIVTNTSNDSEYPYIYSASATAGQGIVFYADQKPTNNIGIIIIDIA